MTTQSLPLLLIKSMRPRQWTKNVLLLAGLFFSRELFIPTAVGRALAAFALFCLMSSAIYLLNDVLDAPKDRLNPRKATRPIAAGLVSPVLAMILSVALAAAGLALSFMISVPFGLCAIAYLLLQTSYCLMLKNIFLVDTLVIAMGFVIRAIAGVIVLRTASHPVPLTVWFVVCIVFLSLFIALCKRRGELLALEGGAASFRPVLAFYSRQLLDILVAMCATCCVLAYTLYATTLDDPWMMLSTLPFVVYGVFRYMHLVFTLGDGEAPEEVLTHDWPLLGCVILWGLSLLLVYLPTA